MDERAIDELKAVLHQKYEACAELKKQVARLKTLKQEIATLEQTLDIITGRPPRPTPLQVSYPTITEQAMEILDVHGQPMHMDELLPLVQAQRDACSYTSLRAILSREYRRRGSRLLQTAPNTFATVKAISS